MEAMITVFSLFNWDKQVMIHCKGIQEVHYLSEYQLKAQDLVARWFLSKTDIDGTWPLIQSMRDESWIKEKIEKHCFIEQKINTSIREFIFLTLQMNYFACHLVTGREKTLLEAKLTVQYCKEAFFKEFHMS